MGIRSGLSALSRKIFGTVFTSVPQEDYRLDHYYYRQIYDAAVAQNMTSAQAAVLSKKQMATMGKLDENNFLWSGNNEGLTSAIRNTLVQTFLEKELETVKATLGNAISAQFPDVHFVVIADAKEPRIEVFLKADPHEEIIEN